MSSVPVQPLDASDKSMKKASKNPPADDMRDEYDIRGGVRGKYARRYAESVRLREPLPIDLASFHEVQARLGYALWQAQALEGTLISFLAIVTKVSPKDAGATAAQIFERTSTLTLRRALGDLRKHERMTANLDARLETFLKQRNWLVHRSRHEHHTDLYSAVRSSTLIERLDAFG